MTAKTLVRVDALFEAALGIALVVAASAGALGADDFPHPVGRVALIVVGVLLLALAGVLWAEVLSMSALAVGNGVAALLGIVWLNVASGFSTSGGLLLAAAVAGLLLLAVAQGAASRARN